MVDTLGFTNAVAGAPTYSGRMLRQSGSAAFGGATPTRPLGARSGVRPGTSATTVTASSTTWTCGPFAGVADLEAAAEAGPYGFAFDAAATGSVTAANATNPRIDIIYVQVDDPSESDGSTVPAVTRKYLAGTAAAVPAAPTTPARSFVVAKINVPTSGGGSPTVTWAAPYAVGAGGILPVASSTLYPATPHVGQVVDDAALGGLYRFNGTIWQPVGVESSADVATFGAGWTATNTAAHKPRLRRVGNQVFLYGAVTAGAGVTITNVLTVPAEFQPPGTGTRFIGVGISSAGSGFQFALTAGVVSIPSGYYTSSALAAPNVVPLNGTWWMD